MNLNWRDMKKNLARIKNYLWTYRKKLGLSQKRVFVDTGIKQSDLSRYEHGVKEPRLRNLLRLRVEYGTPLEFLFKRKFDEVEEEIRRRKQKRQESKEE